MKAVIHHGPSGLDGLRVSDVKIKQPGLGEVRVRLKAAGLNHRDLFLMEGRQATDRPLILGSDGAGIIEEVGKGVSDHMVGNEVIIHPTIGWERTEEVPVVPEILGGPMDGTFAETVVIPAGNAFRKPLYLSWEEAGVLPLSAITAYRALFTRAQIKAGEHVLIPGIGGGVATYAMLMAQAAGAVVSVTSRIISFGASSGDTVDVPLRALFFPQLSWIGTSMGSREEFAEMLQFMEKHRIHPLIDRMYAIDETRSAFQRMMAGEQFGNIGLLFG